MRAQLYYEAHVTIDPVFDERRAMAACLATANGFRLAKLILRKREADAEQPAHDDTFMTGHSLYLDDIKQRVTKLCIDLRTCGFHVRRYKIEDTVLDSRNKDELRLLA